MSKGCSPYVPVYRLFDCSVFVYSFGYFDDAASDNIQEVISLGSGLMYNDAVVCGGRMDFNMFVRYLYERRKSLDSKSEIIFLVTLMFWEYRYT